MKTEGGSSVLCLLCPEKEDKEESVEARKGRTAVNNRWKSLVGAMSFREETVIRAACYQGRLYLRIVSQSEAKSGGHTSPGVPSWRGHVGRRTTTTTKERSAAKTPRRRRKERRGGRGKRYHEAVSSDQFGRRAEPTRTSSPIVNRQ